MAKISMSVSVFAMANIAWIEECSYHVNSVYMLRACSMCLSMYVFPPYIGMLLQANICMYIYIYIYIHTYIYIQHANIYTHTHIYICLQHHVNIYICMYIYIYLYICLQQHANIWRENGEDVDESERLPDMHRYRFRRVEPQDELGEEKVAKALLYVHNHMRQQSLYNIYIYIHIYIYIYIYIYMLQANIYKPSTL